MYALSARHGGPHSSFIKGRSSIGVTGCFQRIGYQPEKLLYTVASILYKENITTTKKSSHLRPFGAQDSPHLISVIRGRGTTTNFPD